LTSTAGGASLVVEHSMGIILSTDGLRPDEREAFWRHVMSDTFAPVAIGEMAEGDVAGSIRGHWAARLLVTAGPAGCCGSRAKTYHRDCGRVVVDRGPAR